MRTFLKRKNFRKILCISLSIVACLVFATVICSASDASDSGYGTVLEEFIDLLVGGITQLGSGIGSGVNGFVKDLFLTTNASGAVTGLSTFGGVVAIFGAIALAVGLTTLIFNWIRSIGN